MWRKGNYWLNLIDQEDELRCQIEIVVSKMIGDQFLDYSDMENRVYESIRNRIEMYGLSNYLGNFKTDYKIDLRYDKNFIFTGYDIRWLYLDEDFW